MQVQELHHDHARYPFELVNPEIAIRGRNRILVIDDDADLRLGLHVRLNANSYDTCFARDAESAISTALKQMPDLIILDLGLPGDDGYAVMKRLKACPNLSDIPIIVVSGRDRFTHQWRARDAGAKQFFEKPVDDRRLLMAIRQLLGQGRQSGG